MGRSIEEQRKTVAQNLTAALKALGKTRKDLAEHFNVSISSVSNWCTGVKKPKTETLVELSAWLGVPLDYLLGVGAFSSWDDINADRKDFLRASKAALSPDVFADAVNVLYVFNPERPYDIPLNTFTYFIYDLIDSATLRDGVWNVVAKAANAAPSDEAVALRDADIRAAFFNGADPTLTEEEQAAMWDDVKRYINFKIFETQQKRKGNK